MANLFIGLFTGILLDFAIGALGVAVQALRYEIRRLNKEIKNREWGDGMTYKGFEIKITSAKIPRQDRNGQTIECDGFIIEIFDTETDTQVDVFNVAVDYELLSNSIDEANQLTKDYIDTEKKSLRKL